MNESATLAKPRISPTLVLWLIIAAAGAAMFSIIALRGDPGSDAATKRPGVGERFVDWRLAPLTGGETPLEGAEVSGQVVLLNMWGPWCHYCVLEMPYLVELREKLAGQSDFRLVSVSCGPERDDDLDPIRRDTVRYLDRTGFALPTYADPGGAFRRELTMAAGMNGYPFTVVLDRGGVIRGIWDGYAPGDERAMRQLVEKLLAAPKPAN